MVNLEGSHHPVPAAVLFNPNSAMEGQRPDPKPAQGNALGIGSRNGQALKGRDKIVRRHLCRPFRAWSSFLSFLGDC